jgi:hypothetical protein
MLYTFKASIIHREKDNFENGCIGGCITEFFGDDLEAITVQDKTLTGLIEGIQNRFNVKRDSILLNSCDELSRLDIQTYTKGFNAVKCSYNQHSEGFKAGKYDLYFNNITGYVTLEQDLDLESILLSEQTKEV